MIIKDYQLEKIFTLSHEFNALLIYGPNEGLIRDRIKTISAKLIDKELVNITGKDIDQDPYLLDQALNTLSMFNTHKLVLVENMKDKHVEELKKINIEKIDNTTLIVKDNNLSKSSKLRKFFETHDKFISLACYEDDVKLVIQTIENFCKTNSINLNRGIKEYLMRSLSVDRMLNYQELEKLKLFFYDSNKEPTLEQVKKLLNDASSDTLQKMNEAVLFGRTSNSSKIISKLLMEGTNPISILRSLMIYLKRVQKTNVEIKKGASFEEAIKELRPAVFWKEKDNFKIHCKHWSLIRAKRALNKLLKAEISCKTNSKLSNVICERTVLQITKDSQLFYNH